MSHLLRRCSHTSQVERNFIYRAIQQQNPTPPTRDTAKPQSPVSEVEGRETQLPSESLPAVVTQGQHQSALDTLAEVSRRQLDISSHHPSSQNVNLERNASIPEQRDAEDQFYAQLREAVTTAPESHLAVNADRASERTDVGSSNLPILAPAPLRETASAATEQLEQTSRQENLDPALENQDVVMQDGHLYEPSDVGNTLVVQKDGETNRIETHISRGLPHGHGEQSEPDIISSHSHSVSDNHEPMSWVATSGPIEVQPASHNLRNILAAAKKPLSFLPNADPAPAHASSTHISDAMGPPNQPISGAGPLRDRTKARSKFSDNRRKEVGEVRRRGACIRCRMLKKPCSEGTPCNTCKTVGSARLWKGSCLRTRLADEFPLWSTGLFASKAQSAVQEVAQSLEKTFTEAEVEICLCPQSDSYVALPAKKYDQNESAKQRAAVDAYGGEDPDLRLRAHFDAHTDSPPFYLLGDHPEVSETIGQHITQLADSFIGHDHSAFLKSALQRARTMIREEEAEVPNAAPSSTSTVRTGYTLQNQLVRQVVDLWTSTTILTRSTPADINIRLASEETTSSCQPQNVSLLHSQLLMLLESRCVNLSRSIISELERRLLQRQQVSRFGTFLSSIILLNCIERMTGYFHAMEEAEVTEQQSHDQLWKQGEHFTALLGMLLRMRGLVPKTTANEQGKMVVVRRPDLGASASELKRQECEAFETAADWLDPLALDFKEMAELSSGDVPLRREGQEELSWDLKFIAGILVDDAKN